MEAPDYATKAQSSTSDRRSLHERLIERPKLMAKLVEVVYDINCRPNSEFQVLSGVSEELGYNMMNGIAQTDWYKVFKKNKSQCKYSSAPKVIIAVRGTNPTSFTDLKSDLRVLFQVPHLDDRYKQLGEVVSDLVEWFPHTDVAIAGHSLGACFALMVGKVQAVAKKPIEVYAFNPPFPSSDAISDDSWRMSDMALRAMFLATYTLLDAFFSTQICERELSTRDRDFRAVNEAGWMPHLFLNEGDVINKGYINRLRDQQRWGGRRIWAQLRKWVEPHTLLSLVFPCVRIGPSHLLPSAKFTIADSQGNIWESHYLVHWQKELEWKSGTKVGGLDFDWEVAQRFYNTKRVYITLPVQNINVKLMVYVRTMRSKGIQLLWSMVSWEESTTQKEVMFMFNTEEDAQAVQRMWPEKLANREINARIQQAESYEFLLQKFEKGAVTFYIYAVKRKQVPFQREAEWKLVVDEFTTKMHLTNWMEIIRNAVEFTAKNLWKLLRDQS